MTATRSRPQRKPPIRPENDQLVRWYTLQTQWHGVHVLPTNDTYEHLHTGSCPCGVHCEGEGPDELIWVHDAFDGREAFDEGYRRRS